MEEEEERHGTHDCEYSREGEREKKKRIEERRRERERETSEIWHPLTWIKERRRRAA